MHCTIHQLSAVELKGASGKLAKFVVTIRDVFCRVRKQSRVASSEFLIESKHMGSNLNFTDTGTWFSSFVCLF